VEIRDLEVVVETSHLAEMSNLEEMSHIHLVMMKSAHHVVEMSKLVKLNVYM
jgi:hypothetical protein